MLESRDEGEAAIPRVSKWSSKTDSRAGDSPDAEDALSLSILVTNAVRSRSVLPRVTSTLLGAAERALRRRTKLAMLLLGESCGNGASVSELAALGYCTPR